MNMAFIYMDGMSRYSCLDMYSYRIQPKPIPTLLKFYVLMLSNAPCSLTPKGCGYIMPFLYERHEE